MIRVSLYFIYILLAILISGCITTNESYYGSILLPSNEYYYKEMFPNHYYDSMVIGIPMASHDIPQPSNNLSYDPWKMGMYYNIVTKQYDIPTIIIITTTNPIWDSNNRPSMKDKVNSDLKLAPRRPNNDKKSEQQIIRRRAPSTIEDEKD